MYLSWKMLLCFKIWFNHLPLPTHPRTHLCCPAAPANEFDSSHTKNNIARVSWYIEFISTPPTIKMWVFCSRCFDPLCRAVVWGALGLIQRPDWMQNITSTPFDRHSITLPMAMNCYCHHTDHTDDEEDDGHDDDIMSRSLFYYTTNNCCQFVPSVLKMRQYWYVIVLVKLHF